MARRPIFVEENKKPLKPEADDQSHKPPSVLKKQRDWRAQSRQPKILVRFDVPKIRPVITELDWDGLSPDANFLHILSLTRDVTDDQGALST